MTEEIKQIAIKDRQITYSVCGEGPPIVLLHAVGLDRTWWSEFITAWKSRYRLIAIDLPGHGQSSVIENKVDLRDLADDVAAVIVRENAGPAHLIGVSMGGMVAQYVALGYRQYVKSLILCSTACTFPDEARTAIGARGDIAVQKGMEAIVEETLERWLSPEGCVSEIGKLCTARLRANDARSWAACWDAISRLETLPGLAILDIPVLVVTGGADVSTPPTAARLISEAISGSEIVIIEDEHHLGAFENSAPFLREFSRFLDKQTS